MPPFGGTDNAPNVIVGGDFTVPAAGNAAETEGLLVVNGDATFDKAYSVGVVGAGTGVSPANRADMLVVGGAATVNGPSTGVTAYGSDGVGGFRTGTLRVGGAHNFSDPSYVANGSYGTLGEVDSANQDTMLSDFQNLLYSDVSVLDTDHYTDLFGVDGKMARYSQQCYAELSNASQTQVTNEGGQLALEQGDVELTTNDAGAPAYVFTSDGSGDLVVFDLPATVGSAGAPVSIHIVGVADGATVLVNTLSSGSVTQFLGDVYWGAGTSSELNALALNEGNALLWNYPFSSAIDIGGPTQFPGSILVGNESSTTNIGFSGSNGRVYTPGDLNHDGSVEGTSGDELHAYEFIGALGCLQPVPGTFEVVKDVVGDGDATVPADTTFEVEWTVTGPSDSPNLGTTGVVTVSADGTPVTGPSDLAEGNEVTFAEPTFPTVDGITWGEPTITPNPVTIGAEDTVASTTVTNTATVERSGFTIAKDVTGDTGATVTEFDVTWSCDAPNSDGDSTGTFTLSDGETASATGFPVGTTCTFSEETPDDSAGTWQEPVISPDEITIVEGDPADSLVTVTNSFSIATLGGFTIAKDVTGDTGATVTEFDVTWSCDAPNSGGDSTGTFTLSDGETASATGFPVGTTCTFSEETPDDSAGTWQEPVISPDEITIVEGDPADSLVTVTNSFSIATLGGFTIAKDVTGDTGATTTEFTGTWTCDAPNADGDADGTWTLADGESFTVSGFATGTACTVSEEVPEESGGSWASSISPSGEFIIGAGGADATLVTVTNTFSPTPHLPETGANAGMVSLAALFLVTLGGGLLVARRRHT